LTVVTLHCRDFEAADVEAVRELPRADFVPGEHIPRACVGEPLRIGHGQVTTEPSLVARLVEALVLPGTERPLEVDTGYGWQSALLVRVARSVWSVERWADLAAEALSRLARAGAPSGEMGVVDNNEGPPEHAPFGAIVAAAAFPSLPESPSAQLAEAGRLVQPPGPGGAGEVVLFEERAEASPSLIDDDRERVVRPGSGQPDS
jgi:protein-L-isoaspartate(D-aspartate) O-methyltransferase